MIRRLLRSIARFIRLFFESEPRKEASIPEAAPPSRPCPPWNPHRSDILGWLKRHAESLAELYDGAVRLLYIDSLPGHVRFVAHAVREIRNRLPEIVVGREAQSRLEYRPRVDRLVEIWRANGFTLDGSLPGGTQVPPGEIPPSPGVSIPTEMFLEISKLLVDHESIPVTRKGAVRRLFEVLSQESPEQREQLEPVVSQWWDATEWFMERAHDSGEPDAACDAAELRSIFEVFESTLGAFARGFFSTVRELDDILEETNS